MFWGSALGTAAREQTGTSLSEPRRHSLRLGGTQNSRTNVPDFSRGFHPVEAEAKRWRISSLKAGDVFRYRDVFYLKTAMGDPDDPNIVVCVRLDNGEAKSFMGEEFCTVVNAEIVVDV